MRHFCLVAVLSLATSLAAQAPVVLGVNSFGYAGPQAYRNVARDSMGVLYMVALDESVAGARPTVLYASYDTGLSWTVLLAGGINGATNGASGANLTNSVNVAINDQDRLHFHFASHYYPSYFRSYYRTYEPYTATFGTVVIR